MSVNTKETEVTSIGPLVHPAVTGWLLFLCLLLVFVYPATTFYDVLTRALPSLFSGHRLRFILLLSVYCIVFAALAVLSFTAGMKLWLLRPDAIRFARRWLWTYLIANFAYFGLWIAIANKPSPLSLAAMGWDQVGPIPSFALWYFYLEHSKRVRATYPGQ
jgi:hypothetical protein